MHILRGVERAAPLVHEQSVIAARAELGVLVDTRNERDAMIEDTLEQRLLVSKRVEMRGLVRRLDVPRALVLTVDALIANERFQRRQRGQGDLEQLTRARFAESFDERGRLELESRQDLPAIARAGTPADAFALEHDDGRTGMGELACGRQARVAGANNGHVEGGSRFRQSGVP